MTVFGLLRISRKVEGGERDIKCISKKELETFKLIILLQWVMDYEESEFSVPFYFMNPFETKSINYHSCNARLKSDNWKQWSCMDISRLLLRLAWDDRFLKGISAWMSQMNEKCLKNMEKSQEQILQRCSWGITDRNSLLRLQSIHAFADATFLHDQ